MIGAYAFTLNDWRELDYPLDLWLKWNSKHFDKIALATYGKVDIDIPSNVIVKEIPFKPDRTTEQYYIKGKAFAQTLLDTEWKVMLDIDEFVSKRIDTSRLDQKKAYAISLRQLYGNLGTEMKGAFPTFFFRIHYHNRTIDNTGGSVVRPYAAKFIFRNFSHDVIRKIFKKSHYIPYYLPYSEPKFEIWHTGAVRRPEVMAKKWKMETTAAINSHPGINSSYKDFLQYVQDKFDYKNYKKIWPSAVISKVDLEALPEILKLNYERFNFVQFSNSEYK